MLLIYKTLPEKNSRKNASFHFSIENILFLEIENEYKNILKLFSRENKKDSNFYIDKIIPAINDCSIFGFLMTLLLLRQNINDHLFATIDGLSKLTNLSEANVKGNLARLEELHLIQISGSLILEISFNQNLNR